MHLELLVIRTSDIKKLSDFYSNLGLIFEYHKHDNSPYHYSTRVRETVLEIYPLAKDQIKADENFRFGLAIDNFDVIIEKLKELNVNFLSEPSQTDYGFMTTIKDPDNRKIELYKKQ